MLKTATLFAILAALAHAQETARAWRNGYAPADNTPCYVDGQQGSVKGALCVISGLSLGKRLLNLGNGLGDGLGLGHGLGNGLGNGLGHGLLDGAHCEDNGHSGTIQNALCVMADLYLKRHWDHEHEHYGFGWFHPGPFTDGDRCWSGHREGIIRDALCIIADINVAAYLSEGYFDRPYYGYGHNFGWYHPGPYIEGDRCVQDGRLGHVTDALCIIAELDVGLDKRHSEWYGPDYWYEPYFLPEYNFGWFHDGPFHEGDRCWQGGRYGSITDSLCVLADLNLNLKREPLLGLLGSDGPRVRDGDRCFKNERWGLWHHQTDDCDTTLGLDVVLGGRSLFGDGDKCWHQGRWGSWKTNECFTDLAAEVKLDVKRSQLFRDDPRLGRGIPCVRDGRTGILRDTICIVADIGINVKRADADVASTEDVPEGITSGWEFTGDIAEYLEQNAASNEDVALVKRLMSFMPGDEIDHAISKTITDVLSKLNTRGLISGSDAGKPSVYGNGAPPTGFLGETGLDKLLGKRLLGGNGFRIDELVDALDLQKRQIGGLGGNDPVSGLLGGAGGLGGGDPIAGLLGGAGGLGLGGQGQGQGRKSGLLGGVLGA